MATQEVGSDVIGRIPRRFINNGRRAGPHGFVDRNRMYNELVRNDLLREDQARELEETLTMVAERDFVGVADLEAAGLDTQLRNIGVTTFEFENVGAMHDAHQSMSIRDLGERDRADFQLNFVPVPVTRQGFQLDRRDTAGGDLSTVNMEEATRVVTKKLEDTLFNGGDVTITHPNGTQSGIPGYTTLGAADNATLDTVWTTLRDNGNLDNAVEDVLTMRSNLRDAGFEGPYTFYAPSNWDAVIDDDYKAESSQTLRDRILSMDGIQNVQIAPSLANDNAVLVQMTSSVVEMPVGQALTSVTWDIHGGHVTNWDVLSVSSFALKIARDENDANVAGISHLS